MTDTAAQQAEAMSRMVLQHQAALTWLKSRVVELEDQVRRLTPKTYPVRDPAAPILRIALQVQETTGVPVSVMKGRDRHRDAVLARQQVMYLAAREGVSTGRIGRALGGRDHTTVMHGIRAEAARRAADSERTRL